MPMLALVRSRNLSSSISWSIAKASCPAKRPRKLHSLWLIFYEPERTVRKKDVA